MQEGSKPEGKGKPEIRLLCLRCRLEPHCERDPEEGPLLQEISHKPPILVSLVHRSNRKMRKLFLNRSNRLPRKHPYPQSGRRFHLELATLCTTEHVKALVETADASFDEKYAKLLLLQMDRTWFPHGDHQTRNNRKPKTLMNRRILLIPNSVRTKDRKEQTQHLIFPPPIALPTTPPLHTPLFSNVGLHGTPKSTISSNR
ncbi:hypothetical protein K440DRAFT_666347 [Wilcoxina mikolae CBS 423.85]|nr:hypothetical protein K440DRAFT_666347 [Wilcoxina mikolae CBS 423.85]